MSSTRLKGEHVSLSGDLPENGTKISLKELVSEITQDPDYASVLKALEC